MRNGTYSNTSVAQYMNVLYFYDMYAGFVNVDMAYCSVVLECLHIKVSPRSTVTNMGLVIDDCCKWCAKHFGTLHLRHLLRENCLMSVRPMARDSGARTCSLRPRKQEVMMSHHWTYLKGVIINQITNSK